jgi:hypothetical protein
MFHIAWWIDWPLTIIGFVQVCLWIRKLYRWWTMAELVITEKNSE